MTEKISLGFHLIDTHFDYSKTHRDHGTSTQDKAQAERKQTFFIMRRAANSVRRGIQENVVSPDCVCTVKPRLPVLDTAYSAGTVLY